MDDHLKDRKHSAALLIGDDAWLAGPIFLSSFKSGDYATCSEIFSICTKSSWRRDFLLSEHFAVALILSSERGDRSIVEMFPHGYDHDIFDAITRPFDGIVPSRTDPSIQVGCKTGTFISECVANGNDDLLDAIHERIPDAFAATRFDIGHGKTLSLLDRALSSNPDPDMIAKLIDYGTPMFTVQPKGEIKCITPVEKFFDIATDKDKGEEARSLAKECLMLLMAKGYSLMFPGMRDYRSGTKKWDNVPVIIGLLDESSKNEKADELLTSMLQQAKCTIDAKNFSSIQEIIKDRPELIARLETNLLKAKSENPSHRPDRSSV